MLSWTSLVDGPLLQDHCFFAATHGQRFGSTAPVVFLTAGIFKIAGESAAQSLNHSLDIVLLVWPVMLLPPAMRNGGVTVILAGVGLGPGTVPSAS